MVCVFIGSLSVFYKSWVIDRVDNLGLFRVFIRYFLGVINLIYI